MLVCDAPKVHNFTEQVCEAAKRLNIDICKLPHNSTTTTQPCDCIAFRKVKDRYFSIFEHLKIAGAYANAYLDSDMSVRFKSDVPDFLKTTKMKREEAEAKK